MINNVAIDSQWDIQSDINNILPFYENLLYFSITAYYRWNSILYLFFNFQRSLQSPELHLYEQVLSGPFELNKYNLVITNEKLGHGQFGMVKKGYVKQDRDHKIPVAVKSLKGEHPDGNRLTDTTQLPRLQRAIV